MGVIARLSESFFCCPDPVTKGSRMKRSPRKAVIAYRKSCKAKGTGLSHYILMDRKVR